MNFNLKFNNKIFSCKPKILEGFNGPIINNDCKLLYDSDVKEIPNTISQKLQELEMFKNQDIQTEEEINNINKAIFYTQSLLDTQNNFKNRLITQERLESLLSAHDETLNKRCYFESSSTVEPFLIRDIIEETSKNIVFKLNKPKFENIAFKNKDNTMSPCNNYYSIMKINNEYRLYYRSTKNLPYSFDDDIVTEKVAQFETFCLSRSNDGLNFDSSRVLFQNFFCHNFFPYYCSRIKKFIGISGTGYFQRGIYLFESDDGIDWDIKNKIVNEDLMNPNWKKLHTNHFDSHNCIVYNNVDNHYYIYIRHNGEVPNRRFIQFTKTIDFKKFSKCELINIKNDHDREIYTPGVFKYFNSNYFISLPTMFNGTTKDVKTLMASSDGLNWVIIDNNLFLSDKYRFAVHGIVPSKDNKKMYIYTFDEPMIGESYVSCYSYPMHRINKIFCEDEGFVKTKLINLVNNSIKLNFETKDNGYIYIEIYNQANKLILKSYKVSGNKLDKLIKWKEEKFLEKSDYYLKFIIKNSYLYSFSYNNL